MDAKPPAAAEAGLCASCRHATVQTGARGSRFWRCRRADADAAYLRYPPLPVLRCAGFERPPATAAEERGASRESPGTSHRRRP